MISDKLNLFFLYILYLYNCINCKNYFFEKSNEARINNSILYSNINPDKNLLKEDNEQMDDVYFKETKINISIGEVKSELINGSYIYNFNFVDSDKESDILINIYPLDCQIKVSANKTTDLKFKKISNYEYGAFSIIMPKDKINSSTIKVRPLINPLEEKNIKREYHLVISSLEINDPKLIFNKELPTLINFDSNLTKMNLYYNYTVDNFEPIVLSFFIKERVKFEARILDSEIPNRIIAYKDNIIIDPTKIHLKGNNIFISIKKIDNKACTMVVKASGNNSPF